MSEQLLFIDPYISLYAFFNAKSGEELAHNWGKILSVLLKVPLHVPNAPEPEPDKNICSIYQQHDAWIVYASVDQIGSYSLTVWDDLRRTLFNDEDIWSGLNQTLLQQQWTERGNIFWGMSIFFGANVKSIPEEEMINDWLANLPLPPESSFPKLSCPLYRPQWGRMWQLDNRQKNISQSPHVYAVLAIEEHASKAENLIFKKNHIDRIELSLHKSYQQLQHYESFRDTLYDDLGKLDEQLQELIETESVQHKALTDFSIQYVTFSKLSTQVLELQNTVKINTTNYDQTANMFNLLEKKDNIFDRHLLHLHAGYQQLKADYIYYEAGLRRFETGLQAIRADLELSLVEQERKEANRERKRNLIFTAIGLVLGLTQIWPIVDKCYEIQPQCINISLFATRQASIYGFLIIVVISLILLVILAIKQFFSDK